MAAMPPPEPSTEPAARAGTAPRAAAPSFSPLYEQIKALILDSLQRGEWKPGDVIPSEFELAARYKVSQGTVRKAIDALAADNLLVRRQGKGTFVASHGSAHVQHRFLRLMPDVGREGSIVREFVDCRRVRASADVARALDLKAGEGVQFARRLLYFDGRPVVLDDIWLPASLFKGLTLERLRAYEGPTYELFEREFGVRPTHAEEKIKAVRAGEVAAELLALGDAGAPLLCVERVAFTYGDRPVELRRGLYDTTHYYYRNELGRG